MQDNYTIRRNIIDLAIPIFYLSSTIMYILVSDDLSSAIRGAVALLVVVTLYYMWKKPIIVINDEFIEVFDNIFRNPKELKISEISKIVVFIRNGYPAEFEFLLKNSRHVFSLDNLSLGYINKRFHKYLIENFKGIEITEAQYQNNIQSGTFSKLFPEKFDDKSIILLATICLLVLLLLSHYII